MFMESKRYVFLLLLLVVVLFFFTIDARNKNMGDANVKIVQKEDKKKRIKWEEVPVEISIEKERIKPKVKTENKKKRIKKAKKKAEAKDSKKRVKVAQSRNSLKKKSAVKKSKKQSIKKPQGSQGFNLLAKYKISMDSYLKIMTAKGGKVVMYDMSKEGVVCQIDPVRGKIINNPDTSSMSIRGRRITEDYPKARHFISIAEKFYGPGSYELILLLPKKLDEFFYGKVTRIILRRGIDVKNVTSVEMEFSSRDGKRLDVRVRAVRGRFGRERIERGFSI